MYLLCKKHFPYCKIKWNVKIKAHFTALEMEWTHQIYFILSFSATKEKGTRFHDRYIAHESSEYLTCYVRGDVQTLL
jgi:hypothetical protein